MMTVVLEHQPPVAPALWPLTATEVMGTTPGTASYARTYVAKNLCAWEMPQLIEDAVLVASELVTNAIRASWPMHATTIAVWLWADGRNLLIEIWDGSPEAPVIIGEPTEEGGRGLAIVASLSQSYGYYFERRGKVVWACLSR